MFKWLIAHKILMLSVAAAVPALVVVRNKRRAAQLAAKAARPTIDGTRLAQLQSHDRASRATSRNDIIAGVDIKGPALARGLGNADATPMPIRPLPSLINRLKPPEQPPTGPVVTHATTPPPPPMTITRPDAPPASGPSALTTRTAGRVGQSPIPIQRPTPASMPRAPRGVR